ncbi:hypothetical protein CPLU01_00663 [Colletotrichum plurivorum]|uniref:Uncharacterized protein n=1 Tax=Colletotrichum plurivorum TaxID=2175906 RepID=A0A8H6NRA3_9PEZI|nr:hypothetical protein CPLU01_00663 [Colletotrichum plurivorum]
MGLDGFISAAEQLTGKKSTKKDQQTQDESSPTQTTNNTDWADAGTAVKAAYENFQADKAQGKGPDYAEIGGAAKKALSACNRQSCGEGKDEGELGREVVAGLCGGQQVKGTEEEGVEGCKVKAGGEGGRGTRSGLRSEKAGGLGEADPAGGEKYGAGVSQGSGLDGSQEAAADEDGSATLGRGGYDEADVTGEKTGSDLADAAQRAGVSRDEAEAIGSFVETG